jgi:CheY-like chemotaxis protein
LAWLETGCRIAEPPKRNGFGINVVTATVKSQLRGDVVFDWRQSGLLCNLSIPVEPPRQTPADGGALGAAAASAAGKSVLLVEDEALVGMMMQDMLTDIGFAPVGPYGRTATALAAARSRKFVAAVLDVNLGGETVYDVADYLAAQNIPFVFVSGYGRESIESRFAGVPLLNKPVERQRLKAALAGCLEPRKIATTV